MFQHLLPRLAVPQLVLVSLAATTFHCQILNRISSGYPLWYMIVALELCVTNWGDQRGTTSALFRLFGSYDKIPFAYPAWIVRAFVLYAVIQAGLYAAFLPPA